ncbi:hypothetical protein EVAR_80404_1 [Eumeta japonica]|uniref:Uncharacterized protein n=1 Tax=Eumeta variegata TaxID=151549 RepID=A0A4C1VI03_EUMVA|nr:hypothetical protein EVAR_80404_1 [Eumeta japonica]
MCSRSTELRFWYYQYLESAAAFGDLRTSGLSANCFDCRNSSQINCFDNRLNVVGDIVDTRRREDPPSVKRGDELNRGSEAVRCSPHRVLRPFWGTFLAIEVAEENDGIPWDEKGFYIASEVVDNGNGRERVNVSLITVRHRPSFYPAGVFGRKRLGSIESIRVHRAVTALLAPATRDTVLNVKTNGGRGRRNSRLKAKAAAYHDAALIWGEHTPRLAAINSQSYSAMEKPYCIASSQTLSTGEIWALPLRSCWLTSDLPAQFRKYNRPYTVGNANFMVGVRVSTLHRVVIDRPRRFKTFLFRFHALRMRKTIA